jgi:hypothetical protein
LAAILLLTTGIPASAQMAGVAVQVSNGKAIPSIAQLQMVLNRGDFVRDVLGWHRADPKCNLHNDPAKPITIPPAMATLYANVTAAGGSNFVTLGFNNKACGQTTISGVQAFPNTPELRAEFAAYAVAVARQIPSLSGISIWNELNGTWKGGYTDRAQQLRDYCLLTNAVIVEVRKVDPYLPIAIGATVGPNVGQWFVDMFDTYGCMGKGDPTIWLDVHPYLSGKIYTPLRQVDWRVWDDSVVQIRAHQITNAFIATEWGARAAYLWSLSHPNGNYMRVFRSRMLAADPNWAGFVWFEMLYDSSAPRAGLFDANGALTGPGEQYVNTFVE